MSSIKNLLSTVKLKMDELAWYKSTHVPKVIRSKAIYKSIEKKTGIPAAFVAAIHTRESGSDVGVFKRYLGNGQPINQVTTIVPKGRGPFKTWEEGAIDALVKIKGYDKIKNWTLETCITEWEKYNGLGYKNRGKLSPYVWSKTNHGDNTGLFVRDGVYDQNAKDGNIGCMALYLLLVEADPDFAIGSSNSSPSNESSKTEEASLSGNPIVDFFLKILNAFFGGSSKEEVLTANKVARYGDSGSHVEALQKGLNKQGYNIKVDGKFFAQTDGALREFQGNNGLVVDGIAGQATYAKLGIKFEGSAVAPPAVEQDLFNKIQANVANINSAGLKRALGFLNRAKRKDYLIFIDFNLSDHQKRLWVINLQTGRSELHDYCAHGKMSDPDRKGYATKFSNVSGSNMSSLGAMVTAELYGKSVKGYSKFQYACKIDGLESINSNVRPRAIVFHEANYLPGGDSLGCPAIPLASAKVWINKLNNGVLMYIHHDSLK